MPRKTWDSKADFDEAYDYGAEGEWGHPSSRPEVRLHYGRGWRPGAIQRIADFYDSYFGAQAAYNQRFCIVGGGFGFVAQELLVRGFTNVVVVDTSAYIQAEKDSSDEAEILAACAAVGLGPLDPRTLQILAKYATPGARRGSVEVLDVDIATSAGRTAVRQALGGWPQIVVTEDVMTSLDDQEAIDFAAVCHEFQGPETVAHIVSVLRPGRTQDPTFNWKTLLEWQALVPGDVWISTAGEVLEP